MSVSVINHAAAEAAIVASRTYAAHVDELLHAIRHSVGMLAHEWRGESYAALVARFDEIIRCLENSHSLAQAGNGQLIAGYERALAEERRLQVEAARSAE